MRTRPDLIDGGPAATGLSLLARWLKASRSLIYMGLLSIGLAGLGVGLWGLVSAQRQNAMIKALAAGEDVSIDPAQVADGVIVARLGFLDRRDRNEEAQALAETSASRGAPPARAALSYNHANALVRRAAAKIEKGDLDGAIPLVTMAKEQYRRALKSDPGNWDIKYNTDIAMRLVRDFPGYGKEGEDETATPKKLWTDLPGIPKGLP